MADIQKLLSMQTEIQEEKQSSPIEDKTIAMTPERPNQERMSLIAITISCMALIITLGIVFSQVLTKQPAMRVVDMAKLLNQQALSLAKVHANGNVPQGVMQQAVEHLKHQLAAYALEHKVILLAKGAVLSGNLQDVTQEIEASIGDFQNQSPRIKP